MQRTELSLFVQEYCGGALRPLRAELTLAGKRLQGLTQARELSPDPAVLADALSSAAQELDGLLGRVEAERATVFVFGPAKSGKTTLVDALAGAWVLDASSRPSYPCVQRVGHAAREAATLVSFDGSTETVGELGSLPMRLHRARLELSQAARAARSRGEAFDAARHLSSAVRRVERGLPAELLERTRVELCECPPVHGPLFSSYGEMLIGETDAARAAVFVVRSAQLCDDTVFDGIEGLLQAFERLLLVVNLDGRARELSPTGELLPGTDHEDPQRLVEAFEAFSTCEPLLSGVKDGRVRLLGLDLLEAARARLRGEEEQLVGARGRARLGDLLAEIAEVLDGHEALHTFARSALRRAQETVQDVREWGQTPGLSDLPRREARAESERAAEEGVEQALRRLGERTRRAWEMEAPFAALRERLGVRAGQRAEILAREIAPALRTAIEDWLATGESLRTLVQEHLTPRLSVAQAELARSTDLALTSELTDPGFLRELSPEWRQALDEAELDHGVLLCSAAEGLMPGVGFPPPRPLDFDAIPVRALLGQRLTFRSQAEVRRALFGPPEAPARELSSEQKQRRLGREAAEAMCRSAEERAGRVLAEQAKQLAAQRWDASLAAFTSALQERVEGELVRRAPTLTEREARVAELRGLNESVRSLEHGSSMASATLEELARRFHAGSVDEGSATLVPRPSRRENLPRPSRLPFEPQRAEDARQ